MAPLFKNRGYIKRYKKRTEEASTVRKIVAIILSCIIIIMAAGGITGYLYIKSALEPVNPDSDEQVGVEVPLGSSSSQIATTLEENGIIKNGIVFRLYTKFRNVADFQAGEYQLSPAMTFEEIVAELQTGTVLEEAAFRVTIPEGKTVEEIAEVFSLKAGVNKEEFLAKANDEAYIKELMNQYPNLFTDEILDEKVRNPLEGYLFAATYEFYEQSPTPEEIIKKMVSKTNDVVGSYMEMMAERELTIHEAFTMASLVEKEATNINDRKEIAGVFYNRLAKDMKLQTDPTVLYAMGRHKERVLYEDLETESPYNTYYTEGLPPGPISNFGERSLEAALDPNETNHMYFVAALDGKVYFSVTFKEHKEKTARYLNREAVDAGN